MPKPRVFVSSIVEGFENFREAARSAIIAAGAIPVLVNEDFPSRSQSSRNACLDGIDSCDIFLLIQGARGGWTAPSGKLVVEEELEHARLCQLRCLAFVQQGVKRDSEAARFIRKVEDYIDGYFRAAFHDPNQLRSVIEQALREPIAMTQVPLMNHQSIHSFLTDARSIIDNQSSIRFLLEPERDEEVVSPVRLASPAFAERLFEIGHLSTVKLLSYRFAMAAPQVDEAGHLVLSQDGGSNWREGQQTVRIEIAEKGLLVIDLNVTGRSKREEGTFTFGGIMEVDLQETLFACFRFTAAVFEEIDPFKRHDVFIWNCALIGSDHRRILKAMDDPAANYPNIRGDKKAILGSPDPRKVSRTSLLEPSEEVARAILRWSQKLAVQRY